MVSLMGGAAGLVSADLLLGVLNRWQPMEEAHLAALVLDLVAARAFPSVFQ